MRTLQLSILAILSGMLVAAGCASTRQIETAPPHPATSPPNSASDAELRAALTVTVETGATSLPAEVQALRFRVAEIRLKPADGDWTTYPADLNQFEVSARPSQRKTILSTQVLPASYDSLSLALSNTFVLFDANAGAPLTMPRDTPLVLPLQTELAVDHPTRLRLTFEPGASLARGDSCRWSFLPFFTATVE